MNGEEKQFELFNSEELNAIIPKDELLKLKIETEKEKLRKLKIDNELRNGNVIYVDKVNEVFNKVFNIIYGTLQALCSETLPYELINCETVGEMRDRLAKNYNDIISESQKELEASLNKFKSQSILETGNEDGENENTSSP
ncbi:MAG: hypothetical protein LBC64_07515 [Fibromonadaceae bacterium]|jgi:hypothetical protein|nr:hypothetical protein [Fibromonadaceae bacterium]